MSTTVSHADRTGGTMRAATVNNIPVSDSDTDELAPDTLRDFHSFQELGFPDVPDQADDYDSGPITLRDPISQTMRSPEFRQAPSFAHWPDEEVCAPSSVRCSGVC